MKILYSTFWIYFFIGFRFTHANEMSLEVYLDRVFTIDPGVRAVQENLEGAEKTLSASDALTDIRLYSQVGRINDERPSQNPSMSGYRTTVDNFSLGLQQQTNFGPKWSLSQNINKVKIEGGAPPAIMTPEYFDIYPKFEVSIPLWRNWAGREVSSEQKRMSSGLILQNESAKIEKVKKRIEIETVYWQLKYSRDAFEIAEDSLVRTKRLLGWAQERLNKNLGEKSDYYQMQAAVKLRELEIENSKSSLLDASHKFNSYLGRQGSEVPEKLPLSEINLSLFDLDSMKSKQRAELVLQDLNYEIGTLEFSANAEKLKPQLDFNASYQVIGRDFEYGQAQANQEHPYWSAALLLNIPLDQIKTNSVVSGYNSLVKGKQLNKDRNRIETDVIWKKNVDLAAQFKSQILILRDLEKVQFLKAEEERVKLRQGRTTTFQVLNFEQDYVNARAQRLNMEFLGRQFIASLQLFQ